MHNFGAKGRCSAPWQRDDLAERLGVFAFAPMNSPPELALSRMLDFAGGAAPPRPFPTERRAQRQDFRRNRYSDPPDHRELAGERHREERQGNARVEPRAPRSGSSRGVRGPGSGAPQDEGETRGT